MANASGRACACSTPRSVSPGPGTAVSNSPSTFDGVWPCRINHNLMTTPSFVRSPPGLADRFHGPLRVEIRVVAGESGYRNGTPDRPRVGPEEALELSPPDQCGECVGHGLVGDVTVRVDQEHVLTQGLSDGPGLQPGEIDTSDSELGQQCGQRPG